MRCPTNLEIQSFVDGELGDMRVVQIAGHLEHCRSCRDLARDLTTTATLLHTLAEVPANVSEHPFAFGFTRAAGRKKTLPRWILVPAAACLLVAIGVAWRQIVPVPAKTTYISAFLEAHRTMPAVEDLPVPCDFGLGGHWE